MSDAATYDVVIISRTNISSTKLNAQLEQVKSLSPDLEVFVLCDEGHPNNYDEVDAEKLVDKLAINRGEFDRLRKRLLTG